MGKVEMFLEERSWGNGVHSEGERGDVGDGEKRR